MKVSVLALLATAAFATASAVPSFERSENDLTVVTTTAICRAVCFPRPQKCPPGWYSKKIGRCWTCCKRPTLEDEIDELD